MSLVRLMEDRNHVQTRIKELEDLFNSPRFNDIKREERGMLTIQLTYMRSYSEVLGKRIALHYNNFTTDQVKAIDDEILARKKTSPKPSEFGAEIIKQVIIRKPNMQIME